MCFRRRRCERGRFAPWGASVRGSVFFFFFFFFFGELRLEVFRRGLARVKLGFHDVLVLLLTILDASREFGKSSSPPLPPFPPLCKSNSYCGWQREVSCKVQE